ncbi:hypothetical protein GH714_031892 [Hevea brasiliensis]|uniref:Cystathionine gamma-synthase n=1 Tax=Hevea brasiliensis TaxID=3981 RepID=A0A6A6LDC7_HEVBR|nr:hypothetical protein GH714_031892 [Hevea brasiliensis]
MAVSSCPCPNYSAAAAAFSPSFGCRSDPSGTDQPSHGRFSCRVNSVRHGTASFLGGGMQSLILKFPPNFMRQLSTKARRNCSNIGVAQVVAASWSNNSATGIPSAAANATAAAAATIPAAEPVELIDGDEVAVVEGPEENGLVQLEDLTNDLTYSSFLSSDGSLAIHAGERLGRGIVTDAITTPVVNTSAYFFKKTSELIDFKEKRRASFEYGRYGNPTTVVAEEKISALEGAESTLIMASGMCASTVMLMALVPAGGHLVTTTDCYRKTRIFIETILPKMGITATVIDPADMEALESALEKNNVSLFFTESPTNPLFRCVDIELVSELCHRNGALVCIDGTFATPLNQKALTLGADLILHSATKFIGGHNDVLAGCISGSTKLVSEIRNLHHILGGTLNPNAAYLIIRGMKTLHLRVQQQNSTALRMAELLEAHPKIDGDLMTTVKFVDSLKIPYIAPSFGGCESIVDQPAIMSYWDLAQSEGKVWD